MTARSRLAAAAFGAGALFYAAGAQAQPVGAPPAPAASRLELAAAAAWSGTAGLGGGAAKLTPNLNGSAYSLFNASAAYAPAGFEARVSLRIASWLMAGISGALTQGDVMVTIGADDEAGTVRPFAGETLAQGQVEARVDVLITRFRVWRDRLVPYAMASGGVFRHWHEGNVLLESGRVFEAGGGMRCDMIVRRASRFSRLGVAADVRMARHSGGFHWGRETRTAPTLRVELYTGWGRH